MAREWQGPHGQPAERREGTEVPVRVHNCSRLGRAANPPRAGFGGWLRRR